MNSRWMMSDFLYASAEEVKDGIIKDVAIVSVGKAKGHNVNINLEFLEAAEKEGNSKKNGIKVRFGHPTMSGNSIGNFLGRASNFKVKDNVLRGDIVLSESAKKAPAGNLYEWVESMVENEPDMLGLSIVFDGKKYQLNKKGEKRYNFLKKEENTFVELKSLSVVDFVDSPAANPNGMFAEGKITMAGEVSSFLDEHPEIYEMLSENPHVMSGFLSKYNEYLKIRGEKTHMKKEEKEDVTQSASMSGIINGSESEINPQKGITFSEAELNQKIETALKDIGEKTTKEFTAFADINGYEFAKENFGKEQNEILKIKNEKLMEEIEELKLQGVKKQVEPVAFSESEKGEVSIVEMVKEFKKEGLGAREAWSKVSLEYPLEYKKHIIGE